ncbi:caspase domain-containing protein [Hysterangium stoloniferum]|nr:caspase domain-containing protein [Hysterangium stoloniferum]
MSLTILGRQITSPVVTSHKLVAFDMLSDWDLAFLEEQENGSRPAQEPHLISTHQLRTATNGSTRGILVPGLKKVKALNSKNIMNFTKINDNLIVHDTEGYLSNGLVSEETREEVDHSQWHSRRQKSPLLNAIRCPRKIAVLVAIGYEGLKGEWGEDFSLPGPRKHLKLMWKLLKCHFNYKDEDIIILSDCDHKKFAMPTYNNILETLRKLFVDTVHGDRYFFWYIGHGLRIDNGNGTTSGGINVPLLRFLELMRMFLVIIPVDVVGGTGSFLKDRYIYGSTLEEFLIKNLPDNCCYAECMISLPHKGGSSITQPFYEEALEEYKGSSRMDFGAPVVCKPSLKQESNALKSQVIFLSSSSASQISWQHKDKGSAVTRAFIKCFERKRPPSFDKLFTQITIYTSLMSQQKGKQPLGQEPQIYFSKPQDMSATFSL